MMKDFLAIISLLITFTSIGIMQQKVDEPISDELYEITTKRGKELEAELKGLDRHDWAGHYLQGDHHPTVFTITPKNGFLVTSSRHTFSPSWVNYGKVEFANGRLRLFPELADDQKSAHVMSREFVLVKWDGYRLLIPPDELMNFAYDVHSRSGSATVDYFAKTTQADPRGLPELPREYLKYLTMSPINATVRSVKSKIGDYSRGGVSINAGRKKGVIKGMSFFILGTRSYWVTLRVDEVSDDRADCHVSSFGTSANLPDDFWIKPGWRFSSRMPKTFAQ